MKYFLIFLICSAFACSQQKKNDLELIPVKHNGKWGFTDENLKFVIQPQYDNALPFRKYQYQSKEIEVATVYSGNEQFCIKKDNSVIKCTQLKEINGFATHTYIQENGKEKEDEKEDIEKLKNTYAKKYEKIELFYTDPLFFQIKKNGKLGIINKNNHLIIKPNYDFLQRSSLQDELTIHATSYAENKIYIFDTKGNLILEAAYGAFSAKQDGSLMFVWTNENPKQFRIFNLLTKSFINDKYYFPIIDPSFSNGYCRVQRGNLEFYINENGKEFIK